MEEYSILAYSTSPLEEEESWMLGNDHRELTNILYKIPPDTYFKGSTTN
jgi:hypothetical protein